jgi:transcriptional regulator with XRE-family HTH domain
MDLRDIFATNLRRLRNLKGISQDDLAYEAGVSRSYLSQLEKGAFYRWFGSNGFDINSSVF